MTVKEKIIQDLRYLAKYNNIKLSITKLSPYYPKFIINNYIDVRVYYKSLTLLSYDLDTKINSKSFYTVIMDLIKFLCLDEQN